MSDIIEEFLSEFLAQDTMKDGFATLVDSEGHPYVANLNPKEKSRYEETKKPLSQVKKEKGEEGKKEPESKKTEEKKKPEAEKKVKFNVGNINYEFTEEEAEKQLRYNDKYIPESEKELKEFTEKKKTIDKERETVEPLDKFYSDYKKALDKFDDDSYLAAASYFNKYKDRFDYLKGQALKIIKMIHVWITIRLNRDKKNILKKQKIYSDRVHC